MMIGYARVSTDEQNLDLQRDALTQAGCERVFVDQGVSGIARRRPGLDDALSGLQAGDTLVVWKLDRLGRSLRHLLELIEELGGRGIGFRCLQEPVDTTSDTGRLLLQIVGALAEFERSLIATRTRAGMQAAARRGKHLGRPASLSRPQLEAAAERLQDPEQSWRSVANLFRVSPRTLRRNLEKHGLLPGSAGERTTAELGHLVQEGADSGPGIEADTVFASLRTKYHKQAGRE